MSPFKRKAPVFLLLLFSKWLLNDIFLLYINDIDSNSCLSAQYTNEMTYIHIFLFLKWRLKQPNIINCNHNAADMSGTVT